MGNKDLLITLLKIIFIKSYFLLPTVSESVKIVLDKEAVWVKRLYSFDDNASFSILHGEDDKGYTVPKIPIPFPFCQTGIAYRIYVCTNGILSLNEDYCPHEPGLFGAKISSIKPILAPFFADLTLATVDEIPNYSHIFTGNYLYNNVTTSDNSERATKDIQTFFNYPKFEAIFTHVTTWYKVRAWGANEGVTFQVAVITNGLRTFARFAYGEMDWVRIGKNAQVGYVLPTSTKTCEKIVDVSLNVSGINSSYKYPLNFIDGNFGEQGVWMYEITEDKNAVNDLPSLQVTVVEISETTIVTGQSIFLFCQLSANSDATYQWYKDGVTIPFQKSLLVKVVTRVDTGIYHCSISYNGNIKKSVNVIPILVKHIQEPKIIAVPSYSPHVNSSIAIYCSVDAYPKPTYKWYKDNQLMKDVIDPVVLINPARFSDTGDYYCTATNVMKKVTSNISSLYVWETTIPEITTTQEGIVMNGSTIVLSCSTPDGAKPHLSWVNSNNIVVSPTNLFTLSNVTKRDTNQYRCKSFKDNVIKYSRYVNINVTYAERPHLTITPSNMLREGSAIHMICEYHSYPLPALFTWKRNNIFWQSTTSDHVEIKNVHKSDIGMYRCEVKHFEKTLSSESHLDVYYLRKPNITLELVDKNKIFEHENIILFCNVDSYPIATCQWLKNDVIVDGRNECFLSLDNITRIDSGNYSCLVKNIFGDEKSDSFVVDVKYIDVPVIETNTLIPNEQTDMTLTCSCKSNPADASWVWMKNDNEIIGKSNVFVYNSLTPESSGEYSCICSNDAGTKSNSVKIYVRYLKDPVLVSLNSNEVIEHDETRLQCVVNGTQPLAIEWFHDDKVLTGQTSEILTIADTLRNNSGIYSCKVENVVSKKTSNPVTLDVKYLDRPSINVSKLTPKEGENLLIACNVTSNPNVKLDAWFWKHNGSFIAQQNKSTILIENVRYPKDSGLYECFASNLAHTKSNSVSVEVFYLHQPTISFFPTNIIHEDSHLIITCNVHGTFPLLYSWFKNDKVIMDENNNNITIENIKRNNSGDYYCSVSNVFGSKDADVQSLDVQFIDQVVMVVSNPLPHTGNDSTLSCSTNTNPIVEFNDWEWKKDGAIISNKGPILNLVNVTAKDSGMYECSVSNLVGGTSTSQYINVQHIDQPIATLTTKDQVIENDTVTLFCKGVGSPLLFYKWFKDDINLNVNQNKLILINIKREQSGKYYCGVINHVEEKVSNTIPIDVQFLDEMIMFVNKTKPDYSEDVLLKCNLSANPTTYIIQWYKNGVYIFSGEELHLKNVTKDDSAFYECSASNVIGRRVASVTIQTQYLFTPNIALSPSNQIPEEYSAIFECTTSGSNQVIYSWYKNNVKLPQYTQDIMILENVTRHDSGIYKCVVNNDVYEKYSGNITLDIAYMDPPVITSTQNLNNIYRKGNLSLTCKVNANASPSYNWYHNNKLISTTQNISFDNIMLENGGNYRCAVENQYYKKNTEIDFIVHYIDKPVVEVVVSNILTRGQSASFVCHSNASEGVSYKWYHDDFLLTAWTSKTNVLSDIEVDDGGNYKCVVSNRFETVESATVFTTVQYLDKPSLSESLLTMNRFSSKNILCSSNGYPIPAYEWIKDGKVLSTNSTLNLNSVKNVDEGFYKCVVKNVLGSKTTELKVIVEYLDEPILNILPTNLTYEDDTVIMTCSTKGSGVIKYEWYQNNVILSEKSTMLILNNVKRVHQGAYHCVVENHVRRQESALKQLTVYYLDSPMILKKNSSENLTLNCITEGNPSPSYQWKHLGNVVSNQSQLVVKDLDGTYVAGYVCIVRNVYQQLTASTIANIYYLNPPKLSIYPGTNILEGGMFVLTCDIDGSLPITYSWLKNDVHIDDVSGIKVFENVSRTDSGSYRCVGSNGYGSKSSGTINANIQYVDPPVISISYPLANITEHVDLELKCDTTGNPNPTSFMWYYKDTFVAASPILNIPNVQVEQSGVYKCIAANSVTRNSNSVSINIQYLRKPSLHVPNAPIIENDTVTIYCYAKSNLKMNFTFYKNDEVILLNSESNMFTFDSISRNESANYSCQVSNELGKVISDVVIVDVTYMDKPKVLIKETKPLFNTSIALQCHFNCHPIPNSNDVIWKQNGSFKAYGSELLLNNLKVKDSGIYECSVKNVAGKLSDFVEVQVQYLSDPWLNILPQKLTVEGTNVNVKCVTDGTHPMTYTWFKDGKPLNKSGSALYLPKIQRSQTGLYGCQVNNPYGYKFAQEQYIDVYYIDNTVISTSNSHPHFGNNVTITCVANANPVLQKQNWTWKFNGISFFNPSSICNIKNITRNDTGYYECSYENDVGYTTNQIYIETQYIEKPRISSNSDSQIVEHHNVSLYCHYDVSPPLTLSWMKNNVLIMNKTSHVLTFQNVDRDGTGYYQCVVANHVGEKISATYYLDVQYIDSMMISANELTIYYGNTQNISCNIHANPSINQSNIVWKKNGIIFKKGPIIKFENITENDAAIYECVAGNIIGQRSNVTDIKIKYLFDPEITIQPSNFIGERDFAELRCATKGSGILYFDWYKDNQLIKFSGTSYYQFHNISRNSTGSYSCVVRNNYGTKFSTNIYLNVSYMDDPSISFSKNVSNIIIGENLTMTCGVQSNPMVSYRWYHNKKMMGNMHMIHFNYTSIHHSGSYECFVDNGFFMKQISTTIKIHYLETPKVVFVPSSIIKRNDPIVFKCWSNESESVIYSWFKNKTLLPWKQKEILISNIALDDEFEYSCQVENRFGIKISQPAKLTVNYLDHPKFSQSRYYFNRDWSYNISCVSSGYPEVSYKWIKNNRIISTKPILEITNVSLNNDGNYQCAVENIVGNLSTYMDIVVEYLEKPKLSASPSFQVIEGDSIVLTCQTSGSGVLHYHWYKDGHKLINDNVLMVINSVRREHNGVYSCVVNNHIENKTSNTEQLIVKYIDQPKIVTQNDTDNLTFQCISAGSPSVTFRWYHLGELLSNKSTLFLKNIPATYIANYLCIAKNEIGELSVSTSANKEYLNSPKLSISPTATDFYEGNAFIFTCSVVASKPVYFSWYKNDQQIDGSESTLIFNKLSRLDSGNYRCHASNGRGTKTSNAIFPNIFYLDAPLLHPSININNIIENIDLAISCTTSSNPNQTVYTWLFEDKVMSTTDILDLRTIKVGDAGTYTCKIDNGRIIKSTDISFTVHYLRQPTVTAHPSLQVKEKNSFTLSCLIEASLPISIIWYKGNKTLPNQVTSQIEIDSINREDSGIYSCSISNRFGNQTSENVTVNVLYLDNPYIYHEPSKSMLLENESVVLICNTSSYPELSYYWMKDGNVIYSHGSVLNLFNLTLEDSGNYKCVVNNGNETKIVNHQIQVHYLRTPKLSVYPDGSSIHEQDNVLLTCSIKSNLIVSYSWYKDNQVINNMNSTHPHQLLLLDVRRSQSGVYECFVENLIGKEWSSINITVQYLDAAVITPRSPIVHENTNITFRCIANSSSAPLYSWYFNSIMISNNNTIQLVDVNVNQAGQYNCKINLNELEQETTTTLVVEYLRNPTIHVSPSNIVNENETAYFSCYQNSSNDVLFSWFKDNVILANETKSTLAVFNSKSFDTGLYTCLTTNKYGGKISNEILLTVSYVTKPQFNHPSPLIKSADENLNLSCQSFGHGFIQYLWYHNDVAIGNNQSNLIIQSLQPMHAGIYKCQVGNGRVHKSVTLNLKVLYLGLPYISTLPQIPTVNEDDLLLLKCIVDNTSEEFSITWFHDNNKLNQTGNLLALDKIKRSQAGSYFCNVQTYFANRNSSNTDVFVNYLDMPKIDPSNPFNSRGQSIEMQCSTSSSHKNITYGWYFKSNLIGSSASLLIEQSTLENDGKYTCVVSTDVLRKEATTVVTIQYMNEPVLEITPSLRPLESESLLLVCKIDGTQPISIRWFFNNFTISGSQATNVINNILRGGSGVYHCVAENIVGIKVSNKEEVQVRYLDTPTISRKSISNTSERLLCETKSYPLASYYWLKDGQKVSTEKDYIAENINTTKISNYQCVVQNEVGEASASTSSSSHYLKSASLYVTPSLELIEKQSVVFRCEAEGTPPIVYSWYKDSKLISGEKSQLLITNSLHRNDRGSYSCKVLNDAGARYSSAKLLKVYFLDPLQITSQTELKDIFYGNNVTIQCATTSFPVPSCQWLKENKTFSIHNMLSIKEIKMADNGEYTCICTNGVEQKSSSVIISVNYLFNPAIHSPTKNQVTESEIVILDCISNSSQDVTYTWEKNGILIAEKSSRLLFSSVNRNDRGKYTCITESRFGSTKSTEYLLDVYYLDAIQISANKTILLAGDSINVSCYSNAHPSPAYEWFKDGKQVLLEPVFKITNAWIRDEGVYECRVSNQVTSITKSIEISFQYLFEPTVVISPSNSLVESASALINCNVNGTNPISYTWYKNNVQLLHSEKSFILNNLRRTDSGDYHCEVGNIYGNMKSNKSELEVKFLDRPSISRAVFGDILNLSCSTQGTFPIHYAWFANGKRISNESHVTLSYNGTFNVNYRCLVTNIIGSKSADTTGAADYLLTVDLTFHPSNIINEGDAVTLHCNADGTLPISYDWYKDNVLLSQEKESVLMLGNIHVKDKGYYQCVAGNNAGSKRSLQSLLTVDYINFPVTNSTSTVSIKKGKYFVLSCMAVAKPSKVEILWWKGNSLYSNSSLLRFPRIDEHDSGDYWCLAKNTAGEKRTKVAISVLYLYHPHLTSSASNTTNEGDMIMFLCNTTGTTPISYQWYKESKLLNASGNILRLNDVTRKDMGQYFCVASNSYGELTSVVIPLHIAYLDIPILSPLQEIYKRFSDIVVTCNSRASPKASYTWFKNTKYYSNGNQLIISNANNDDSAVYECEATNGLKSRRQRILLQIQYMDVPTVLISPSNITNEGDFIVMTCQAKSSEQLTYQWYKDGIVLPWKQDKHIINDVRRTDSGNYTCAVVSDIGSKISDVESLSVHYLDEPKIKKYTLSKTSINLQCLTNGIPIPNITWYKDEYLLSHNANLTIHDIIGNETYRYRCVVINLIGQLSVATTTSKDYLSRPLLSIFPAPILVKGSSFVIKCSVDATPPLQFLWKQDENILQETSDILVKNNLRKSDHGSYSCRVSNAAGSKESQKLSVTLNYLEAPVITEKELVQGSNQYVTLDCNSDAYPPAGYIWRRNGVTVFNTKTIELTNADVSKSGNYECEARNDVKNMTSSVTINFKYLYKPSIEVFPNNNIKEGDAIIMICHVDGSPPLACRWYKDNVPLMQNGTGERVRMTNVTMNEAGSYTCECSNELAKQRSKSINIGVDYVRTPTITINGGTNIYEGETKFLECSADGVPTPSYKWLKDGHVMSYNSILQLINVKQTNTGMYSCVANNKGGERTKNVDIFVQYIEQPSLSIIGNIQILSGSILSVSCKVESSQLSQVTYKWYKDNQLLASHESRDFVIKDAKTGDSGVYSCVAKLKLVEKTSQSFLNLTVKEPIGTIAPVCNLNQVLTKSSDGIVYCACADGFYGQDCSQQCNSLEGTGMVIEICEFTFCMNSKEAYDKMTINGQYHHIKNEFEKQLLSNLRLEMGNTSVINVRLVNFRFDFILKLDFMIYFDAQLVKSNIIQIQNELSKAEVKHYVNTRSISEKLWFRVTPNSMKLKDYNHCTSSSAVCDENADCLNGDMMYHCRCREKFYGNGKICYPLSSLSETLSNSNASESTGDCNNKLYEILVAVLAILLAIVCTVSLCCIIGAVIRRKKKVKEEEENQQKQYMSELYKPRHSKKRSSSSKLTSTPTDSDFEFTSRNSVDFYDPELLSNTIEENLGRFNKTFEDTNI